LALLEQIRRRRAIVERGAADRRIRDLERYNDHIIQNMNSALVVVDAEARVTACNPPAERILGQRAEAIHGRALGPGLDGPARLLQRALAEGARFRGAESEIAREDGSIVPIGISCSPILDSDGVRIGAVATFQDLSEIRQLQRQVLESEKLASLGQLSAGVAHEINNPMGFIHANLAQMAEYVRDLRRAWTRAEELLKAVGGGSPDEIRHCAERLAGAAEEVDVEFLLADLAKAIRESQEGSERIRHIVSDLRDFSRQDSGHRVLTDVNQIGELREGEILVCPVTAPSWAPVFAKIRAAVSDIGGSMSHAAIVAREYGMPAVVGTGDATKRIRTGDTIRVDGDRGTVRVLG